MASRAPGARESMSDSLARYSTVHERAFSRSPTEAQPNHRASLGRRRRRPQQVGPGVRRRTADDVRRCGATWRPHSRRERPSPQSAAPSRCGAAPHQPPACRGSSPPKQCEAQNSATPLALVSGMVPSISPCFQRSVGGESEDELSEDI